METIISALQILAPLGIVGMVIRFAIDRIWSTSIEFDLENNYSRAFREIFNVTITIILIGMFVSVPYMIYDSNEKESARIDVVTRAHKEFNDSDMKKIDEKIEKENTLLNIIIFGYIIFLIVVFYALIRGIWFSNYRRKAYILYDDRQYFVIKRIFKDKLLLTDNKKAYKLIDLSELNSHLLYKQTVKERNVERYDTYYKSFRDIKKQSKWYRWLGIILLTCAVLVIVFIGYKDQDDKALYVATFLITALLTLAYFYWQIRKGKNQVKGTNNKNKKQPKKFSRK